MIENLLHRLSLAACLGLAALTIQAEGVADLPVKVVNGHRYHYYEVQPRETVYSITRKLGITSAQLFESNPKSRDGLKAYEILLFPAEAGQAAPAAQAAVPQREVHKVKKGETVYGISKKYGVTKEQIFEWNPTAKDGIKAGQDLYVSAGAAVGEAVADAPQQVQQSAPKASPAPAPRLTDYVVREKETFFSIARNHGISIHELERANPDVGILRPGMTIRIPSQAAAGEETVAAETVVAEELQPEEATPQEPERLRAIDIALTLPVMAGAETRSRQADIYLDFYKGFLIAVDSMRHCGTPINVRLYDTYGSTDSLMSIINSPDFAKPTVVIGPDEEDQLSRLGGYGKLNEVYVLNPFVVRDEEYVTNPYMMQCNIPQTMMYDKAIEGLITRFADHVPVLVNHTGGSADKEAFVGRLKTRLTEAGIEPHTVNFSEQLSVSDFDNLPADKNLLLIPTSGKQAELNRLLPVALELKNKGRAVRLFGYPEWTTFRGETLDRMHKLNAVVYSRFYADDDESRAKALDGRFVYWYGQPMMNVLPKQGLLGFDTGMYLINALLHNNGDMTVPTLLYDGIQNGFHFSKPNDAEGLVNDVLYFINYNPEGVVDKTVL